MLNYRRRVTFNIGVYIRADGGWCREGSHPTKAFFPPLPSPLSASPLSRESVHRPPHFSRVLFLARWMSVGEFFVLLVWVGAMISHLWQGAYRSMERYHDGTGPCPDDPTSKCYLDSEDDPEPAESTAQKRYGNTLTCDLTSSYFSASKYHMFSRVCTNSIKRSACVMFPFLSVALQRSSCVVHVSPMVLTTRLGLPLAHPPYGELAHAHRLSVVAVYFGFVASCHLAVILIPVARDSKLWSAVGIPFERAVLYHVIAGHLAFTTLFLHAFLFVVSWVWEEGWNHAWAVSTLQINEDYGDVDVPMGWTAGLCALPMWVTSVNYVRRRLYSLFKASHWLFIGVFVFGALHVRVLSFVDSPLFRSPPFPPPQRAALTRYRSKHDQLDPF